MNGQGGTLNELLAAILVCTDMRSNAAMDAFWKRYISKSIMVLYSRRVNTYHAELNRFFAQNICRRLSKETSWEEEAYWMWPQLEISPATAGELDSDAYAIATSLPLKVVHFDRYVRSKWKVVGTRPSWDLRGHPSERACKKSSVEPQYRMGVVAVSGTQTVRKHPKCGMMIHVDRRWTRISLETEGKMVGSGNVGSRTHWRDARSEYRTACWVAGNGPLK